MVVPICLELEQSWALDVAPGSWYLLYSQSTHCWNRASQRREISTSCWTRGDKSCQEKEVCGKTWLLKESSRSRCCQGIETGNNPWKYRIIEYFGVDRTIICHPVHTPCNEQAHLQLGWVAQSPVQPDLECFQGRAIYREVSLGISLIKKSLPCI